MLFIREPLKQSDTVKAKQENKGQSSGKHKCKNRADNWNGRQIMKI